MNPTTSKAHQEQATAQAMADKCLAAVAHSGARSNSNKAVHDACLTSIRMHHGGPPSQNRQTPQNLQSEIEKESHGVVAQDYSDVADTPLANTTSASSTSPTTMQSLESNDSTTSASSSSSKTSIFSSPSSPSSTAASTSELPTPPSRETDPDTQKLSQVGNNTKTPSSTAVLTSKFPTPPSPEADPDTQKLSETGNDAKPSLDSQLKMPDAPKPDTQPLQAKSRKTVFNKANFCQKA
ncbi:hypothetical protein CDD82_867 [Ophiocordyceps australis]|uniref:Uncharacterized protein n=1 Tax=Ophiocordyceps australis TaxID=1399860 RepID=A0A2C5XD55_9HYPO|nr:hypothetical protein CDD82_867 [Ophiocordyceps australis]